MKKLLLLSITIAITFFACKKEEGCTDPVATNFNSNAEIDDGSCEYTPISTNLTINFTHTVDATNFILGAVGTLPYTNNAGQPYNVKRLWYIISDITLHAEDGTSNLIKDIHFIDASEVSTLSFITNDLEDNNYTSISYTMGLNPTRNISNAYVNEDFHSKMFWPEFIGGGYHYMKLEGNFNDSITFYNTHTGPTNGEDYSFIHTDIITLVTTETTSEAIISINMEINNWYQNPNSITISNNGIMENMPIQMQMKQNGSDVFSTLIN